MFTTKEKIELVSNGIVLAMCLGIAVTCNFKVNRNLKRKDKTVKTVKYTVIEDEEC